MTSFKEGLEQEIADSNAIETARLKRERDSAVNESVRLTEENETLRRSLEVIDKVEALELSRPKWLAPEKPKKSAATLVVMLSDLHLDEVVNPDEVDGLWKSIMRKKQSVMVLKGYAGNVILG